MRGLWAFWLFVALGLGYSALARISPPPSGAPQISVRAPELFGPAVAGAEIFERKCAGCHGALGAGREGMAPALIRPEIARWSDADLRARLGNAAHRAGPQLMPEEELSTFTYLRAVLAFNGYLP